MKPIKLIRNFGNSIGLAWWARIETKGPDATYWFGPFLTKKSLNENLKPFLNELTDEGSNSIKHSLMRCKRTEPLTIF